MSTAQLNNEWRTIIIEQPLFDASESIYAIIEPELWPEWHTELSSHVDELETFELFKATQFNAIKNGPVVVNVATSQTLFEACVDKMSSAHCGALFYTENTTSSSELMYSLRNALIVKKGNGEVFLRYYDPRGLLPLVASMSDTERRDYFTPVTKITWFNKAWLTVSISNPIAPPFSDYQWVMTEHHFASMQSISTQW
ncbi:MULTISPECIES: DUF4123 domain-containing protein [Aliivibrio]|uniref:DUF4123 domain-containing protein n=1 Tax=Aliivibrio finisterrensis TaxID=511998 RepID=A0A4Q5KTP2_9GAMM|nr:MULTISPECIES: DUF4123 domain-containing protein [Aliivibrio]MDD9177628.1 DUF4123 domain-containing protein [Aliivibrio sp. A6]RYU51240.1 DUF4123 domain-containing protein [Aliivibrio finisterrensis]RYU54437.1 DUF4123 domain-containing protein [Aliivibrio finisterrensis]RYU59506.1 DUF4123 domain-containing protein [Aliivibrio finisterrensis]RYU65481.1 DUF4123 domain-containing protein [Aliivibrio finisterrensis]